MRSRMVLVLAVLLTGCATSKKLYDGPDRDEAELAVIAAKNSYVFSINGRRTDHAREPSARLRVLPGTQQLIVHLDERMAESYGHVGVRTVFCAQAGRAYTVYPVPDMIARLWEPAVRDESTGADVSPKPCAGSPPPPVAPGPAVAPMPAPKAPAPAPAPAPTPPAAAPAPAPAPAPEPKAATPTSPVSPPAPATTAPPAQSAAPVPPPPAGAQAKLRAPARTRSLIDAPAAKGLEAGVTVTLKVVLKKDTGAWWYVTGPSGSGWVREADLEPVAP